MRFFAEGHPEHENLDRYIEIDSLDTIRFPLDGRFDILEFERIVEFSINQDLIDYQIFIVSKNRDYIYHTYTLLRYFTKYSNCISKVTYEHNENSPNYGEYWIDIDMT